MKIRITRLTNWILLNRSLSLGSICTVKYVSAGNGSNGYKDCYLVYDTKGKAIVIYEDEFEIVINKK